MCLELYASSKGLRANKSKVHPSNHALAEGGMVCFLLRIKHILDL